METTATTAESRCQRSRQQRRSPSLSSSSSDMFTLSLSRFSSRLPTHPTACLLSSRQRLSFHSRPSNNLRLGEQRPFALSRLRRESGEYRGEPTLKLTHNDFAHAGRSIPGCERIATIIGIYRQVRDTLSCR